MNKKELRQQVLTSLQQKDPLQKKAQEQVLAQKLYTDPFWQAAQTIGITMSMPHELATLPIIQQALKQQETVLIPRVAPQRQLLWFKYDPTAIKKSRYGILEPSQAVSQAISSRQIDLLLVPGVAFQPSKTGIDRIGYGGGYYDRLLQNFDGHTLSLAFQEQLISGFVFDHWDQKVEKIIF